VRELEVLGEVAGALFGVVALLNLLRLPGLLRGLGLGAHLGLRRLSGRLGAGFGLRRLGGLGAGLGLRGRSGCRARSGLRGHGGLLGLSAGGLRGLSGLGTRLRLGGLSGLAVIAVVLLAPTGLIGMVLVATVARLGVDLEPDLDAFVLVLHRLGVDVPATVVASGAGPECGRAVVGKVAAVDVEAAVRFGANVALLLRGRRSQDAAAVLAVVDAWEMS
jgi:hypothetical protein